MPLRDHFRPPLDNSRNWEGLHGGWPMMIVAGLRRKLPPRYLALPRVHLGASAEVDVANQAVYEVRVYDENQHSHLVAAVEIVSPADKDRPEHRRAFVSKCAGLLREQVSVVIVDVVTTRTQNLYGELLDYIGVTDPSMSPESPSLYVTACRVTKRADKSRLETWAHAQELGRSLPTVPLWLTDDLAVPLDLEDSYEQSCTILNIP